MSTFDPKVVQDQLRDALLADPAFSIIPVISADPGDITTAINAALEQIGIGVLILTPGLHVSKPNLPGPYFDHIRIIAEIVENPTINRAATNPDYVTATTLAMVVAGLLHGFAPAGINERVYVEDAIPVPDPTKTFNLGHVEMTGKAGVKYAMPAIAPVVPSSTTPGSQTITLSCATPGAAAIWFTLDGSYPSPRNPNSQLYIPNQITTIADDGGRVAISDGGVLVVSDIPTFQPLVVAAGQTLKARAWLAGYAAANPEITTVKY